MNRRSDLSSRVLSVNTLWNLAGYGAPPVVAIFAIPLLLRGLGTERFGVLMLAMIMIGYFGLFDFGIGRSLTKLLAEKLADDSGKDTASLIRTAMILILLLGLSGTVVLVSITHWLVYYALKIPEELKVETEGVFYVVAISIPFVVGNAGFRAIMEANQRFDLVNLIRVPISLCSFLGPLALLPFSNSVFIASIVLLATTVMGWLLYLLFSPSVTTSLREGLGIDLVVIRPLVKLGGWMTVSNIIGPIMTYMDRIFVGSLVSIAGVAYYATPYEIVTRFGVISGSIASALFPVFSASALHDRSQTLLLFDRGVKHTFIALVTICLIIVTFAYEGMNFWLGRDFAEKSTRVLQMLAGGVFINGMAQLPFALVQGAGRPDLTGKLHILELPFYLMGVVWLISEFGIEGAAIAWVARVVVDAVCLQYMVQRILREARPIVRSHLLMMLVGVLLLWIGGFPLSTSQKLLFLAIVIGLASVVFWSCFRDRHEEARLSSFVALAKTINRARE